MSGASENVTQCIRRETADKKGRVALLEGGRSCTYGELFELVGKLSNDLANCKGLRGALVAFHAQNSIEYVVVSLALLELGAVLAPVPYEMPTEEIDRLCRTLDASFLTSSNRNLELKSLAGGERTSLFCGELEFCIWKNPNAVSLPEGFSELEPAFIRFTSGTTDASKGVILSQRAVLERSASVRESLALGCDDCVLWVLSMAYHFVSTIVTFLRSGMTIIICREPVSATMRESLMAHPVTLLYATPWHYGFMGSSPMFTGDECKHVRHAVSTAMMLDSATAERFYGKFKFRLTQAYGIIEAGLPCVDNPALPFLAGCVGRPNRNYELSLADVDGGCGRILLRGGGMFSGYFSPFERRGNDGEWFDTGDLGSMTGDGRLKIVGRAKQVIIFAGMKVFPGEVENVIRSFPGVADAILYGESNASYGEIPVADVVLHDGSGNESLKHELRRHCYAYLESYKVPKDIHFVAELEKTLSGKTRKSKNNETA